jgi:hypothetical protein
MAPRRQAILHLTVLFTLAGIGCKNVMGERSPATGTSRPHEPKNNDEIDDVALHVSTATWPSHAIVELERELTEGRLAFAAQYADGNLKILYDCKISTDQYSLSQTQVHEATERRIFTRGVEFALEFPIIEVGLSARLEGKEEFVVSAILYGEMHTFKRRFNRNDLSNSYSCKEATHVISASQLGAAQIMAQNTVQVQSGVQATPVAKGRVMVADDWETFYGTGDFGTCSADAEFSGCKGIISLTLTPIIDACNGEDTCLEECLQPHDGDACRRTAILRSKFFKYALYDSSLALLARGCNQGDKVACTLEQLYYFMGSSAPHIVQKAAKDIEHQANEVAGKGVAVEAASAESLQDRHSDYRKYLNLSAYEILGINAFAKMCSGSAEDLQKTLKEANESCHIAQSPFGCLALAEAYRKHKGVVGVPGVADELYGLACTFDDRTNHTVGQVCCNLTAAYGKTAQSDSFCTQNGLVLGPTDLCQESPASPMTSK